MEEFRIGEEVEFHWHNGVERRWVPAVVVAVEPDRVRVRTEGGLGSAPKNGRPDDDGRQVRKIFHYKICQHVEYNFVDHRHGQVELDAFFGD